MKDLDDKLSEDDKKDLNEALDKLKAANASGNVDDIKTEIENLNSIWSSKSSSMYANSTDGTEPPMQEAPSSDDSSKKDEKKIEDADFEVVED